MDKKDLSIVLGITDNVTFTAGTMLMDVKKYLKNTDFDVIIYHQGLENNNKKALESILPCSFIEYEFPITDEKTYKKFAQKRYTLLTFSRFECFNLLKIYKKVLWLDTDILITRDLSDIFNYSKNGFAACVQKKSKLADNYTQPIKDYDMNQEFYNAGICLMNDNIPNYEMLADWCYKKTQELVDIITMQDQSILNLMILDLKLPVDELPEKFNAHPRRYMHLKDTTIIHAYGQKKFWNYYYFKEWENNYKTWLKLGGNPYTGIKKSFINRLFNTASLILPPELRRPKYFLKAILNQA